MADVKFNGSVVTGNNKPVKTLKDALSVLADCDNCGCDECLGYWTNISATTGERVVMYITGAEGGPYTLNIADYDTGIAALEVLKAAR